MFFKQRFNLVSAQQCRQAGVVRVDELTQSCGGRKRAFLGKMGISNNDRERAIELLAQYALIKCDRVAALRKLDVEIKPLVMHQLATFAFEDYSRSAASVKQCDDCNGEGL